MPKKPEKVTLNQDFSYANEAELGHKITAFQAQHEAEHWQILAMDAKRSLGVGRARVTFRVIEKKKPRG